MFALSCVLVVNYVALLLAARADVLTPMSSALDGALVTA